MTEERTKLIEERNKLQYELHQFKRDRELFLQKYEPQLSTLSYIRDREKDPEFAKSRTLLATTKSFRYLEANNIDYHMVFTSHFYWKTSVDDGSILTRGSEGQPRSCKFYNREAFRKRLKEPYHLLFYYCSIVEYGEIKICCHFEPLAA